MNEKTENSETCLWLKQGYTETGPQPVPPNGIATGRRKIWVLALQPLMIWMLCTCTMHSISVHHVQSISKRLPIDKRQYLQAFCISYTRYQCLLFTFRTIEPQSQCSLYQEYKPVVTSHPSNIPQKNLTFYYNTVSQSYIYH